jgi:hypothetical protein
VARPQGRDHVGQQVGRDGGDDAEPQGPVERLAELAGGVGQVVRVQQQLADPGQDRLAAGGEEHAAGRPLEEAHADLLLELLHLGGEGRLGDVAALGGAPEAAQLRHGLRVLELAQREGVRGGSHRASGAGWIPGSCR